MLTRRLILAAPMALVAGPARPEGRSRLADAIAVHARAVAAGGVPRAEERQLATIPATTVADAAAAAGYVASWCNEHCADDCARALATAVATFLKTGGIA